MMSYADRHKIPQKRKRFLQNVRNLRDLKCVSNSFPRRPATPPRKHRRHRHLGLKDSRSVGALWPSVPSPSSKLSNKQPTARGCLPFGALGQIHHAVNGYLLLRVPIVNGFLDPSARLWAHSRRGDKPIQKLQHPNIAPPIDIDKDGLRTAVLKQSFRASL